MSSRRNSTSSMARKTPKSTPNLLKQALTKTIFSDETPNQSANNTAVGVEKAKTQFNLFKDTPRTILGEKPADDAQLAATDDLFKAAKAATRARREKSGRLEKRKDVLEDVIDETENRNPSEHSADEDISKSPGKLFRLKRKSRMITTRRLSQDGSLEEREAVQSMSNNSENDEENMEEVRPPAIAPRRSIRSHARYLKESFDEVEATESSVENEMPQRGLRRSIRPVTRSVKGIDRGKVDDGPLTNESEDHDNVNDTPNFQAVRVQKPNLKTDFRKQLDHLQRAPTPSVMIEDFRATGKAINVAELDITFDPNIESTRVGLNEFEDEEGFDDLETSPKRSSRRKSASRLSKSAHKNLSQEDRGSYLNFEGDDGQEEVFSKRMSQEMMPPPPSTVVMKTTSRSHRLDSVLDEEPLISDATVANLVMPPLQKKKQTKAKTTKREKSKEPEILSDKELRLTFEKVSGLKVGPAVQPMLRQVHHELYREAMETLDMNTNGLSPKLGDWKDMFQELGYLPKEDPDHSHLYALLRKYCTPDEMLKLVPRPTLHGGGKWTMDRNIWDQRAVDFSDDDSDPAFGAKKKKRGAAKRSRKAEK